MWIPTPIYERIPQFYFLIGLLFVADALYMGFEFVLAFYYIGFGFLVSLYGIGIFAMRAHNRQQVTGVTSISRARRVKTPPPDAGHAAT